MAKKSKDYNDGYQAAIEALKKIMSGDNSDLSSNRSDNQSGDSLTMPGDVYDKARQEGGQSSSGGQSGDQQVNPNSGSPGGGGQQQSQSRGSGAQGVVRPEDCIGPGELNNVPGRPGGMIERSTGDKMAESEGYEKEGGSEDGEAKSWAEAALKEAPKLKGDKAGSIRSKLEGLYKVSTNWKKALKSIVGHSISPDDKRQAYANKNILISQDRIARTDKDKYDNLDYMMAWIDSSGSMSDEQLRMCLSEVYAVALAKKPIKLIVVQCDTRIQDIKEYTSLHQLKKDMIHATVKGRGGTELKPCWDLLTSDPRYRKRRAELIMIFTDGCLTQYKRNPRTMQNLCWVILDNPSWSIQYKDMNTKAIHLNTADIK